MKNITIIALCLGIGIAFTACCGSKKVKQTNTELNEGAPLSIRGKVTEIENGKDGYTATVKSEANKTYKVTISRINLEQSKSAYKKYAIGEQISVTGEWWKDTEGNIYIKATKLR
ncbi:MAG: hypothetical protein EOP54_12620 [Sphingobacteriales bacterium]|nr:MAG: hypothetical protein EOP54_12620 [Sphingobacteriales bacterium]